MTYAIISDIHANLEALETALAIIAAENVDEIICLGDIVGYGASPNECAALVKSQCSTIVLGNHDAAALDPALAYDFNTNAKRAIQWTADQLNPDTIAFLSALPLVEKRDDIFLVHASPDAPGAWNYVVDAADAISAIRHFSEKLCFIGHTHIPGMFSRHGRAKLIAKDEQHLINVGSIGQPRDGNPMLAFGIFDSSTWSYRLVRSKYDIEKAAAKIYAAGLPEELGFRLMYGM
jgi:predicted phosphodiesterase